MNDVESVYGLPASGVFLYSLRLYVDQEVHVTAGLETGATKYTWRPALHLMD
ncbi:MAG: hypothetical protein WCF54_16100 [Terracidiphilus sp.]